MRERRIRPHATITASALIIGIAAVRLATVAGGPADGWPSYGHDPGGMRFSPLTEIDRTNVARLEVAWTVHTGDISDGSGGRSRSGFETTPIVVDEVLYFSTPFNRVIALDPETGKERWSYDPKIDKTTSYGDGLINRGVSTWLDAARRTNEPCRRRIYEATLDARLIALDARTGTPCADFGRGGHVDLTGVAAYRKGEYHMTSPPAVVDDVVIVGSAIDDNERVDMPDGVVRAFDARTGAPRWRWDPISRTAAAKTGAANAWSIMSVDAERHLVFVPTGSASPDYYGGLRPGDNRWASSVVALRAKTGEVAWGFQLVHHDLWDYDTAAPPLVATVHRDGRDVPVVIQGNKTGFVYVLNRDTGAPVFPVEERRVPASDVDGERASATQPFPVDLPPLAPQSFSADAAWGATDADRDACRDAVRSLRNDGIIWNVPPVSAGAVGAAVRHAAMGLAGRSRSDCEEDSLAGAARIDAALRCRSCRFDSARIRRPRRAHRDSGRSRVHRRRCRFVPARVRRGNRARAVEGPAAGERARDADDVSHRAGGPSVRRRRRRRPREDHRREAERRARRVRPSQLRRVGKDQDH